MSNSEFNNLIQEVREALNGIFGDKLVQVWLYGSYAKGNHNADSDIDIMVLVDLPKNQVSLYKRKVSDISSEIDLEYDVFLSTKLQNKDTFLRYSNTLSLFRNILKEGKRIV